MKTSIKLTAKHLERLSRPRRIINQEDGITPFGALKLDIGKWLAHRFPGIRRRYTAPQYSIAIVRSVRVLGW